MSPRVIERTSPYQFNKWEKSNYPSLEVVVPRELEERHCIPMSACNIRCLRRLEVAGIRDQLRNMYLNDEVVFNRKLCCLYYVSDIFVGLTFCRS